MTRRYTALAFAVILATSAPAPSGGEGTGAALLFIQRLTRLLSAVSGAETPLHVRVSDAETFFEAAGLRLAGGELSLAGRLRVDPATGAFEGVLERLRLGERLELARPARVRGAPDGTLGLEGLELSGSAGTIGVDATLDREGRLSASARVRALDLQAFGRIFTDDPVAAGRLSADAAVDGSWETALLRLAGSVEPGPGMPAVEGVALQAVWASGRLTVTRCEGRLGGSPFRVTGRIDGLPDFVEAGSADLRLEGEHLLLYRTEQALLRGDADLRLHGPAARLTLSGRVALTEGRYEGGMPALDGLSRLLARTAGGSRRLELFTLRPRPWRDTALEVALSAPAPVQIATPAVRIAARPELRLTGTGESPSLIGRVDFEPGVLHLPGGRLVVSSAALRFQRPDPDRPTLEVVGRGRLQGYEVTAVAEGPWDEPRVTLSSYPVLANDELVLLVLTGQNPRAPRPNEPEKSRGLTVAVALGKDMLSRFGGAGSGAETTQSVVDRFDVEVGRGVTRSGDETVHVLFRMADEVVQSGGTLFLAGERDVFGYYNGGVRIVFRFP